eukprot:TRINITY_DN10861_c0_g1_i1.p1 TRINITY_DN10861_c0_g1~~TRINITY_DN10861_c0_g1_i1.p1  ORF type:complete len:360 (+),score=145.18 TRINITY_DN10861_c0_g1_i1:93-1082(+)
MHDRKREELDDAKKEQQSRKLAAYRKLCQSCAGLREHDLGSAAESALSKILLINPEFYTMWNTRRLLVQDRIERVAAGAVHVNGGCGVNEGLPATREEVVARHTEGVVDRELQFNRQVIESRDQKSYCTWQYRRWLHGLVVDEAERKGRLKRDRELCERLLRATDRNFHCWDYRRWVCRQVGWTADAEYAFTKKRVDANFSNYSAWHQRALLLKDTPVGERRDAAVAEEIELVQNAFYTEPQDQSGWLYALWLVRQGSAEAAGAAAAVLKGCCEELVADDGQLKWPRVALAKMASWGLVEADLPRLCESLAKDDPMRAGYYRHLAATRE